MAKDYTGNVDATLIDEIVMGSTQNNVTLKLCVRTIFTDKGNVKPIYVSCAFKGKAKNKHEAIDAIFDLSVVNWRIPQEAIANNTGDVVVVVKPTMNGKTAATLLAYKAGYDLRETRVMKDGKLTGMTVGQHLRSCGIPYEDAPENPEVPMNEETSVETQAAETQAAETVGKQGKKNGGKRPELPASRANIGQAETQPIG